MMKNKFLVMKHPEWTLDVCPKKKKKKKKKKRKGRLKTWEARVGGQGG
jgi:hypothetical protein